MARLDLRRGSLTSLMLTSSIKISPDEMDKTLNSASTVDDLPLPVRPHTPTLKKKTKKKKTKKHKYSGTLKKDTHKYSGTLNIDIPITDYRILISQKIEFSPKENMAAASVAATTSQLGFEEI